MNTLKSWLTTQKVLVADGAWGTELRARGIAPDECPEQWNVDRPDDVRAVAEQYVNAGADLILTNTYGGNEIKLARFGLPPGRVRMFNAAGAALSLEVAAGVALVAASVGPAGAGAGEDLEAVFERQVSALSDGGARIVCIETMSSLEEACAAVRGAKRADPGMEIIATMTFERGGPNPRTAAGVEPARAADALAAAGADVIGANCGMGIAAMVDVARAFRAASDLPIMIQPNAGTFAWIDGEPSYTESPAGMATHVPALLAAGANIVGGCCGATPAHVAALRAAVDAWRSAPAPYKR